MGVGEERLGGAGLVGAPFPDPLTLQGSRDGDPPRADKGRWGGGGGGGPEVPLNMWLKMIHMMR